MVRVTFKYVGQGDSILLEWTANGEPKIGIIDCKKESGRNPVLEHIVQQSYSEIEFLLLSHPHRDHLSGMEDLLRHCAAAGIGICYFFETTSRTPERLTAEMPTSEERRLFKRLMQCVIELKPDVVRKTVEVHDEVRAFPLGDGIDMEWLSPSDVEHDAFLRTQWRLDLSVRENPAYNLLCTVVRLSTDDSYALLTSDAMPVALRRVNTQKLWGDQRRFVFGQVPHHGSKKNLVRGFWRNRKKLGVSYAVVSVGSNNYGHPDPYVLDQLMHMGYSVQMTGQGMSRPEPMHPVSAKLLPVSQSVRRSKKVEFSHGIDRAYELG